VATVASCQEACDKCSGGLCVATVLSEGKCHFRGCNSSCMVFQQSTCPTKESEGVPGSLVRSPGSDLYAKNVAGHFCMEFAFSQQAAAAAAAAAAAVVTTQKPQVEAQAGVPKYCPYLGQDCEPGNEWHCEQPAVPTAESCQEACDQCSGGLCAAVVLMEGKCHFRGCNSSCMVFEQSSCPTQESEGKPKAVPSRGSLYARNVEGHFCREFAFHRQEVMADEAMVVFKWMRVSVYRETAQVSLAFAAVCSMAVAAFAAVMSRRARVVVPLASQLVEAESSSSDLELEELL